SEQYLKVVETAEEGGYPLLEHLRKILKGPIVWAPGVAGAVVLSMRGGDFEFNSGEDLSVGYDSHDAEAVSLYIEESYSFRVLTPEAAVAIAPPKGR
ncbi:MAG TPA: family 1 encapsulin nanocompartment shell protein, partial [Solirubrobacteraceae bacterium]|nr:family 1 encapsulin nanocompartment shell protein [Solirubrobacteraceae bacterium]